MSRSDFTEGRILAPLLKFGIPIFFALLLQTMYTSVDLIVIGQFRSSSEVAAVATGGQIMTMISNVVSGIAVGTTVFIGQKLGERKNDEVGTIIGSSIFLFFVFSILVTVLVSIFAGTLSSLMMIPPEAYEQTNTYMRISAWGSIFFIAYNVLGAIFRGLGDSKTPLLAVLIACIINIFGDLYFVAVLGMGVEGVAIATVMAQAISVIISILIIRKRKLPFHFTRNHLKPNKNIIKRVLDLGVPIALQDFLIGLSMLALTSIVNSLGLVAAAGIGVSRRLILLIMLIPIAFMQSLAAFVAQNVGAKEHKRAKKALAYGLISSLVPSFFIAYFTFFHGDILSRLFTTDTAVILASWEYLRAYAIDCMQTPIFFCMNGYFNGYGKTKFVMIQNLIGALALRMPVAYFMSRLEDTNLFKIGLATPISSSFQIIFCVVFFIYLQKRIKKTEFA